MNHKIIEGSKMRMNFYFVYLLWQSNQEQDTEQIVLVTILVVFLFYLFAVFKSKLFFRPLISPFSRKNLFQLQSHFHPVIFPRRIMAKPMKGVKCERQP